MRKKVKDLILAQEYKAARKELLISFNKCFKSSTVGSVLAYSAIILLTLLDKHQDILLGLTVTNASEERIQFHQDYIDKLLISLRIII